MSSEFVYGFAGTGRLAEYEEFRDAVNPKHCLGFVLRQPVAAIQECGLYRMLSVHNLGCN